MIDRRALLRHSAQFGLAASLSGLALPSFAQAAKDEELKVPGALGDVFLGSDTAKVTIYEYA